MSYVTRLWTISRPAKVRLVFASLVGTIVT